MSNLEQLGLYLTITYRKTFIDGNDFKKMISSYLPKLNLFEFHICSRIFFNNQMNILSKEDLEETFRDFPHNTKQILSCVDYYPEKQLAQYHVYTYPSKMKYYQNLTNSFPDGLYPYVRLISLYDRYPFEHEFFIRISQSFPFLEELSLINQKPQKPQESDNSTIVEYDHLLELHLSGAHDDYLEEFLSNRKTTFLQNVILHVDYESLERVTENFTRDDTRVNCAKINKIYIFGEKYYSKSLQDYFPSAEIPR